MKPQQTPSRALLPALIAAAAFGVFAACLLGATPLSPGAVLKTLLGMGDSGQTIIVWEIRMPRAICAFAIGATLGLSGAAMQGLLRNPLAEPGVLGVSGFASLGAVITIYYGVSNISPLATPLAAIFMAILATGFLAAIAQRVQSVTSLILAGVGLSSIAGALLSLIMNIAPNPFSLSDMIAWMLGSVANRSFDDLLLPAPFMAAGAAMLLMERRALSALTLGEEAAQGVGLDLERARRLIVLGAGMATGAAVSLGGAIAFVGIVVPHLVRPLVGHDPGRALAPSAIAGGAMLVFADILVRILPGASELKLGVVAALIGAPAFIWIALRRSAAESSP